MTNENRGSMTVELVMLVPVLTLFALIAIGLGRYELAREQLIDAARAAAEAASVASSPVQAQSAAISTATLGVEGLGPSCKGLVVAAETNDFKAGGSVVISVRCQVRYSDLLVPGLPGSTVLYVTQTAPIDPYRSVQ
jgi:Flp pilus assembly protein TadG